MTAQGLPRIAVAGCGNWGVNIIRNFAELGVLEAVVDTDTEAATAAASRHGCRTAAWRAVLDDPSIPAVAVATPAEAHHALAREALMAGKHVFVEKPLALTVAEAEDLCRLAEQLDRRLMVGHLLQYHPAFLALRQLVREGRLGRIQYVYSNRLNLGKIRRHEDILWSFAPHDISMILSLLGQEPERVEAFGGYFLHKSIADTTTTHLSFPAGEQAHVFVSWLHPYKEQKLVVVGTEAMGVFDDGMEWEHKLRLYPHTVSWRETMPVPLKGRPISVPVEAGEPLRLECRHFLDCVATGAHPRTDGREGLRVLSVLARATESLARHTAAGTGTAPVWPEGVQVHKTAVVDRPSTLGAGTRVWHFSHILPRTRIGRDCVIGQNAAIGPDVTVGDRCKIQNNVSVYAGVTLEDGVFCGPSCVFTNVLNPRAEVDRKAEFRPTLVRRGATIGANATIVCGHTLGAYCFIAAGAVVTSDVPAFALMAGMPARRIGWVSHDGERLGPDLVCPRSRRRYRETGPDQLEEIADA